MLVFLYFLLDYVQSIVEAFVNLQLLGDDLAGMHDGGVVLAEFIANFGEGKLCQLVNQIHGNVAGKGYVLVAFLSLDV